MVLASGIHVVIIGQIVETVDAYVAPDLITSKKVIDNPRLVDALIPKDYVHGKFILNDKNVLVPDPDAQPDPVPVKQVTFEEVVQRLSVVESKVPKDATGIEIKP